MNIKRHIPNFLTCCNLLCGCLGIIACFQSGVEFNSLTIASYLIFIACLFDFLDGFVARLLKVTSPIGKELDSLADCITFGILPGMILFQLIGFSLIEIPTHVSDSIVPGWHTTIFFPIILFEFKFTQNILGYIQLISLAIPVFSAIRLAKFNIDTRQSESFIGVPTPANALLIASLPLILANGGSSVNVISHPYFLISLTLIMSFLLIAELPLFALKFKDFTWKNNQIRFSFLAISALLLIFLWWTAIPIIIFLYILLSFIENKTKKTQK